MSLNRLIENTTKPWLNIRVNDLVVDGTLIINDSGITPGTYGSSTNTPLITVDSSGLITNITQTPTFRPIVWDAGMTVSQSIAGVGTAPAGVDIVMNSIVKNDPAWYNSTTGFFTVPDGNEGSYQFNLFVSFTQSGLPLTNMVMIFALKQVIGGTTEVREFKYVYDNIGTSERRSITLSTIVQVPNIQQSYHWVLSQTSSDPNRAILLDGQASSAYCQLSVVKLN